MACPRTVPTVNEQKKQRTVFICSCLALYLQLEIKLIMSYDILQPIPQGGNGAQDAEDSRIAEIADELERLCRLHEAQRGAGQSDVVSLEDEQRVAEQMAKATGYGRRHFCS